MWAIDMTDVFVICKFTPSPSVLRTATSPSQEGEAMRVVPAAHWLRAGRRGRRPLRMAEKAKEKGHPKMSFEFNFSSSRFCLCRPTSFHCCLQERSCASPDIRRG